VGVNFLSIIFEPQETNLAFYGIGYALSIAALAYFIKVRSLISKRGVEGEHLTNLEEAASADSESSWLPEEKKG
jgi:hypothetical protein